MKRHVSLLACLVLVVAMVFTLASCDQIKNLFGKPECTEHVDANTDYVCDNCGAELEKPAEHTHEYSSEVTTAATCTADGVKTFTCSCGDSYTEAIPATGHTDADTNYVCDVCEAELEGKPEPEPVYTKVYLDNNAGWENVYYYCWNDAGANLGAWPGTELTAGADGLYSVDIPEGYTNIIFNNNTGLQTADLKVPTDENVVFDNVANAWTTYALGIANTVAVGENKIVYVDGYTYEYTIFAAAADGTYTFSCADPIAIYVFTTPYTGEPLTSDSPYVWNLDESYSFVESFEVELTAGYYWIGLNYSPVGQVKPGSYTIDVSYVVPEVDNRITYTFESKDLTAFAAGAKADGDTENVGTDGFFKLIYSAKTKVDTTSNKKWEDGYEIGADKVNRLAWSASSFVNDATNGTKNVVEINLEGPATVKVWWICGDAGRQVAIFNADGTILTQTNIEGEKNAEYLASFDIEKAGKYYIGNVGGNNYYIKLEAKVTPAEKPEGGDIKVVTKNSYGYNNMADPEVLDTFTAPVAGYYSFNLPAGLGLWSKATYEAWGDPEVDFYSNTTGETYAVELAAGEVYEFYVGAMTEEEWTITWTYSEEAPPEPTVVNLQNGDNAFTLAEIDLTNGVTGYLTVYQSAIYTFKGTGLYINVYNSWGELVTRGFEEVSVSLEGGMWGSTYEIILGAETVGEYSVNVSSVAPTELYDGDNTVTVDADGADCVYYAEYNGSYFFTANGATVTVNGLTANEDGSYTLEAYTTYNLLVTAETAGDYVVKVVAPVYLSQGENTVSVGANGAVVYLSSYNKGHFNFSGEGLTIVIKDAEGNVVENNSILDSYAVYTIEITVAEAGDYVVNVVYTAPIGSDERPEKIESLPATLTPDLSSAYSNYYYQFTATANGHATLSYTANGAVGSVAIGDLYLEEGQTSGTIAVVAGQTYKVYFSCGDPVQVSATVSFEAGEITEAEWKDMILYTYATLANGTQVSLTQPYGSDAHYVFHYQYTEDWEVVFKAYYTYTVTANEDGTLTLKLTYVEGYEENVGTPAAIGDLKLTLVEGEWVVSCVHVWNEGSVESDSTCTVAGSKLYTCTVCGGTKTEALPLAAHADADGNFVCDTEGCTAVVEPAADSTLTLAQATALGTLFEKGKYTTNSYWIEGVIDSIDANGTMTIKDADGNSFYIYKSNGADGTWYSNLTIKHVKGDTVKVYGVIGKYDDPQMQYGKATVLAHEHAYADATCTAPKTCACGATEGEAKGHTEPNADGLCDVCKENISVSYTKYSLSFADVANRTEGTTSKQVWVQNGVTFTNEGNVNPDYSNPVRCYKNSTVKVECSGMSKIVFHVNSGKPVANLSEVLTGTDYTVAVDGQTVTVTFNAPVDSISITASKDQFRLDSIDVYVIAK